MSSVSRAIRAFPVLLRIGFAEAVAYRAEMIVWMLTTTMPLVSLALWSAVAQTEPVGRFTAQRFGAYFLAALVVRQVTGSWLVWQLNMDIRSGTLATRLMRPLHPLVAYAAENISAIPLRALISLPVTIITFVVIEKGALPSNPAQIAAFLASLAGAWAINFLTMALIGTLAFYIDSSTAIFEIWLVAFMLLSGYMVPLELFPPWLNALATALPFRYTLAFPVEVLTGMLDGRAMLRDLAIQWAYVIVSAVATVWAWRQGLKRFAAFGG